MDPVNSDFQAPRGWRDPHLQTLRSRILPTVFDLSDVGTSAEVIVDLDDGTGDRIRYWHHTPFRNNPAVNHISCVVLIHGLGGSANSEYMLSSAHAFLQVGIPVARVDLRGAGDSYDLSRHYYHAGRTEDVRAVLRSVLLRAGYGVVPMGFSLGGNMTVKVLGEPDELPGVLAGISVSTPLDLVEGSAYIQAVAFGLYERFIVFNLRHELQKGFAELTEQQWREVRRARRLEAFDNAYTAPENGWRDAIEYYSVNSSSQFLPRVQRPLLMVHSADDPMVPVAPYERLQWYDLARRNRISRAITGIGGHLGFHERGRKYRWFSRVALQYLLSLRDGS